MYRVILKNIKDENEKIVLYEASSLASAEDARKYWRKVLGNKNWIDRRPGLDTLDHLALKIEKCQTIGPMQSSGLIPGKRD